MTRGFRFLRSFQALTRRVRISRGPRRAQTQTEAKRPHSYHDAIESAVPAGESGPDEARPRLLLIGRDGNDVGLLIRALERDGYAVCVASERADGLSQARQIGPSAIVLAGWEPEPSEIDICRALRETDPGVPIVALAVTPQKSFVNVCVAALDAGASDCLAASYEPGELVARAGSAPPTKWLKAARSVLGRRSSWATALGVGRDRASAGLLSSRAPGGIGDEAGRGGGRARWPR